MRADAQRSRDRILSAAAEVVAELGAEAPMETIARRANVGVGTLYRRFPDRAALLDALAREHAECLLDAFGQGPRGWKTLRGWIEWSVEHGRGALAIALADVPVDDLPEFVRLRERIAAELDAQVAAAHAEGGLRAEVSADDLSQVLKAYSCHPMTLPSHLLPLLLDGMAPPTP